MNFQNPEDTICALSTAQGVGAISLIRLSGRSSIELINSLFSKNLSKVDTHTAHFGVIKDGKEIIDEVLVNIFRNPNRKQDALLGIITIL